MNDRKKNSSRGVTMVRSGHRAWVAWFCLLMIMLLVGSVAYALLQPQHVVTRHSTRVMQLSPFKPVVGDVNDPERDDPDITVQQELVPGFQFHKGGYTLSGKVIDAQTRQFVPGAVVWIDLPVTTGQRSSVALHTVTDAKGSYQFTHLARGSYTVVASRYYDTGDGHYYAERVFSQVGLMSNRPSLVLSLTSMAAPGRRFIGTGQARNVILIDLRGFYAASLLDDPMLFNQTQNLRVFLRHANVARSIWQPYGWRPLDQYALLTGTYPAWATYDPWPHTVAWGLPDNIDTTYWFTGGRSAHLFGQESIFDVAKGYGMQTSVVAGGDYLLSDATTRNLDVLQRSRSFDAARWLSQMQDDVLAVSQQKSGYLLYAELAPLAVNEWNSSPDAQGDDYQQALLQADQTFGQLMSWLRDRGLLHDTLIALTTSQAQANHTDADNFYGMGSTGQGTSKQTLLALSGPGECAAGSVNDIAQPGFVIAPEIMHLIGLPAPAESRFQRTTLFQRGSCL